MTTQTPARVIPTRRKRGARASDQRPEEKQSAVKVPDLLRVKLLFDKGLTLPKALRAVIESPAIGSQSQMEKKYGLSRGAQVAILGSKTQSPSLATLRKIEAAMNAARPIYWRDEEIALSLLELQYLCQLSEQRTEERSEKTELLPGLSGSIAVLLRQAVSAIDRRQPKRARALIADTLGLVNGDVENTTAAGAGEKSMDESEQIRRDLEKIFSSNARRLLRVEVLKYLGQRGIPRASLDELTAELYEDTEAARAAAIQLGVFLDSLSWNDLEVFAALFSRLARVLPAAKPENNTASLLRALGVDEGNNSSATKHTKNS